MLIKIAKKHSLRVSGTCGSKCIKIRDRLAWYYPHFAKWHWYRRTPSFSIYTHLFEKAFSSIRETRRIVFCSQKSPSINRIIVHTSLSKIRFFIHTFISSIALTYCPMEIDQDYHWRSSRVICFIIVQKVHDSFSYICFSVFMFGIIIGHLESTLIQSSEKNFISKVLKHTF